MSNEAKREDIIQHGIEIFHSI
ncbi:DNA mismatch repair protein, partial [Bacillus cereus]